MWRSGGYATSFKVLQIYFLISWSAYLRQYALQTTRYKNSFTFFTLYDIIFKHLLISIKLTQQQGGFMKKIYFLLLTLLFTSIFSISICFAEDNIIEVPKVKIIIDGKIGTYGEVPINVNNRTLLPLRALLVNLGVQNDNDHIIWNAADKSVTVIKDSKKINLKINSKTAYINDLPISLDVEPIIYKDRTYIPARFIAQSLGKKVVWDGSTSAVLIRDDAEFESIKNILDTTNKAMSNITKAKYDLDMNIGINQPGLAMDMKISTNCSIDLDKDILAMNISTSILGTTSSTQSYVTNNGTYTKNRDTDEWEFIPLSSDEFKKQFDENNYVTSIEYNDALCAGLVIQDSENENEIFLKGDVYSKDLLGKNDASDNANIEIDTFNLELVIDKNTNFILREGMTFSGKQTIEKIEQKLSSEVDITFTDYNDDFDLSSSEIYDFDICNSFMKAIVEKDYNKAVSLFTDESVSDAGIYINSIITAPRSGFDTIITSFELKENVTYEDEPGIEYITYNINPEENINMNMEIKYDVKQHKLIEITVYTIEE